MSFFHQLSESRSSSKLAIVTLVALTTILPELFSGSTPVSGFLNPGLLIFLTLGYGAAVLLVRELTVRWGCGLMGTFFAGLSYSIFNEGLLAKTLIVQQSLPINQYDHYGYVLGVSWPWMAAIGAWHAGASVLFPIAFTHHLFPEVSRKPWLNGKAAFMAGAVLVLLSCAVFLGITAKGLKGTPGQLILLLALIACGFVVAYLFKGCLREPHSIASGTAPLLLGFSVVVPFWALSALAGAKIPVALFFAVLCGVVLLYAWILKRRQWLTAPAFLFFAVGWYIHNALQSLVFIGLAAGSTGRALLTGVTDFAILAWLFLQAHRLRTPPVQASPKAV
jgi:hypothetical protein